MAFKKVKGRPGVFKKRRRPKRPRMSLNNKRDAIILPSLSSNSVLPNKTKVTLRYAQKISLNSGIGLAATQVFSANGAYDPDISGVGHQPRGFDQYMTMYDHYQVIGSRITVAAVQPSVSGIVGIALRDTNVATPSYTDLMEERGTNSVYGILSTSGEHVGLDLSFSQKKFFGTSDIDDKYQGSVAGNPQDGAFFHVWNTAISDVVAMSTGYIVNIDYIIVFTEPKNPPQS